MPTTSKTSLCGAATVFVVRDVIRSVEHYREVLGFDIEFTYGQPTFYAGVNATASSLSASRERNQTTTRPRRSKRICE